MPDLHIHPDITRAHTLPTEFYTSSELYQRSKELIFAPSWQFLGDTGRVNVPAQLLPVTLLEGFLDEPLLLSRDKTDALGCFSNVCTHRGNILVESACIAQNIKCRYHGRRFGLDGIFQYMPEFEGVEGFPSEADNLHRVPLHQWQQFLFASLRPAATAESVFADMTRRVGWLPLEEFVFEPSLSRDYLVQAHWALYCENYLEGFHIPYVHQSLNETLDYGNYTTELFRYSNLQLGIAKGGEHCFELPTDSPDFHTPLRESIAAYYFWVFPNMMFNFYPWGLSINIVRPLGIERTKVSFLTYVWDASKRESGAGAGLDRVEREDEAIVEQVQRGIRSRFYSRGRYSPKRETGTHHFHRLIAECMSGENGNVDA